MVVLQHFYQTNPQCPQIKSFSFHHRLMFTIWQNQLRCSVASCSYKFRIAYFNNSIAFNFLRNVKINQFDDISRSYQYVLWFYISMDYIPWVHFINKNILKVTALTICRKYPWIVALHFAISPLYFWLIFPSWFWLFCSLEKGQFWATTFESDPFSQSYKTTKIFSFSGA